MSNTRWALSLIGIVLLVVFVSTQVVRVSSGNSRNLLASVTSAIDGCHIRVGYFPHPSEDLIKDPNTGKLSGIFHDAIEQMGQDLGCKIDWVQEVTFATMIEGLNTGKYDIVPVVWPNAQRAKSVDFTIPIYYSAMGAYVRTDDDRFDNVRALNDPSMTIVDIDGEAGAYVAKTQFPSAKTYSLPQGSEIPLELLNVTTGKADATLVPTADAAEFIDHNPHSVKSISANYPVAIFPVTLMVPKNQEAFKSMLNTALEGLINNGTIDTLIKKYEKHPGDIYPIAKPYAMPQ
jgi:polar amino acid transport system substrate-binding protein